MQIKIGETYNEMCQLACQDLIVLMQPVNDPLICVASGDSPKGLYQQLTHAVEQREADTSLWNFVGLDEWAGMNDTDEGSCHFHLQRQLFKPLGISGERLCFFNGRANDLQAECQRVEDYIETFDGIDVAIVGLGLNGHVGMNEPGTPAKLHAHVADIDPTTQQVGQKYFNEPKLLTHGLTMGIANLMEATTVMLLVSGSGKAGIVQRILTEEISEQLPATLLRNHPGLCIYLDKDAATLLPQQ